MLIPFYLFKVNETAQSLNLVNAYPLLCIVTILCSMMMFLHTGSHWVITLNLNHYSNLELVTVVSTVAVD
jgi:hypothetical protein